jgi:hexosaminidase
MKILKIVGLVVIILSVTACKHSEIKAKQFLKKGTIQLALPMLSTNNTIISDNTLLTIGPVEDGLKMYYTMEGSEPTKKTSLYTGPLKISTECVVTVRAFHPDWLPSEVSTIEFFKAGVRPASIKLLTELSEKYPGNGVETLIDNKKGTSNFSDSNWIGINNSLSAIVDFGEPKNLQSIKICFIINTGAWIFPPKSITILKSDDGINFKQVSREELDIPTSSISSGIAHTSIDINIKIRYIKVHIVNIEKIPEWHDGRNQPSWVFMDEWIFN